MDDTKRLQLTRELDNLCADLEKMAEKIPQIKEEDLRLAKAQRAAVVLAADQAARRFNEAAKRSRLMCMEAERQMIAARASRDTARIEVSTKAFARVRAIFDQDAKALQSAMATLQNTLKAQGFADAKEYQEAVMDPKEMERMRKKLFSFSETYNSKLARAKELDELVGTDEDEEEEAAETTTEA